MPTLSPQVTPYYGGGQVVDPANVIQVTGAPSTAAISNGLGTLAVDNANKNAYILVSKTGGTATWDQIAGGSSGLIQTINADSGTASPAANAITLSGTPNQITTAASGSTVTYSLPAAITAPGSLTTTTSLTATLGNITATNGNLNLAHTGNKLLIHASTAASDSIGTATLGAGGTVTVSTSAVTTNSLIFLTYNNCTSSLAASLFSGNIVNGTSFDIFSQDATDATSTVNYWIVN